MGLLVEPIDPPDIEAWQISPYAADDVVAALGRAASLGYTGTTTTFVQPNSTDVLWTLKLSKPGAADQVAYAGYWLVCDGRQVQVMNPQQFVSKYTVDVPLVWEAAPVAVALPADQVVVTFPQPTSPCGPFTYTVTTQDGEPLNVVSQTVENSVVTLKGDGLITGDEYEFVVTVTNNYGAEQTSEPAAAVTAIL